MFAEYHEWFKRIQLCFPAANSQSIFARCSFLRLMALTDWFIMWSRHWSMMLAHNRWMGHRVVTGRGRGSVSMVNDIAGISRSIFLPGGLRTPRTTGIIGLYYTNLLVDSFNLSFKISFNYFVKHGLRKTKLVNYSAVFRKRFELFCFVFNLYCIFLRVWEYFFN